MSMDILTPANDRNKMLIRLINKIQVTNTCWVWQGGLDKDGYGITHIFENNKSNTTRAHRLVYTLLVEDIPNGLVIDHICENPPCVNPEHLEVVTVRENTMRGTAVASINARKTHCLLGHPFDEHNTRYYKNQRVCRKCSAAKCKAWRLKRRLENGNAIQG